VDEELPLGLDDLGRQFDQTQAQRFELVDPPARPARHQGAQPLSGRRIWVSRPIQALEERSPTMEKNTLVLPSLSPIGDKPISVMIEARCTSADGGVLLFQGGERRLNLANRLAACLHDRRQPGKITHSLDDILRFRMLAIVAGYPDGNDCDVLRDDPAFKMALDRSPVSGPALCLQPSVSRIENLARRTELYRMAEAMLDLYCDSFPVVPYHLTLDLDESFDRVHGKQELPIIREKLLSIG
jgi:hypothetical protein